VDQPHQRHHLVWVRGGVDDAQAVKTLAHELGHVLLHQSGQPTDPSDPRHLRDSTTVHRPRVAEVEAESVAYLVAATHGLDTDDYTLAYVTSWAADVTRPARNRRPRHRRTSPDRHPHRPRHHPPQTTLHVQPDFAARVQTGAQRTAATDAIAEAAADSVSIRCAGCTPTPLPSTAPSSAPAARAPTGPPPC